MPCNNLLAAHAILPLTLCIIWDGVAPHIRYLGAVYRDECSRGVVRGSKPDEIVERLGPGSREGFCGAL